MGTTPITTQQNYNSSDHTLGQHSRYSSLKGETPKSLQVQNIRCSNYKTNFNNKVIPDLSSHQLSAIKSICPRSKPCSNTYSFHTPFYSKISYPQYPNHDETTPFQKPTLNNKNFYYYKSFTCNLLPPKSQSTNIKLFL